MEGGTTFHFVTDGIHAALARAKEAARGKDVRLGGGVATVRQYLAAGLVDEMHLVIAPALLGRGENLFAGIDLWRNGAFSHGGFVWSPHDESHDGFVFKLLLGAGTYRYRSGALGAEVVGTVFTGYATPGWRFVRDRFTATIYAGLDVQRHDLLPDDPGAGLRGTMAGLRTAAEIWWEPSSLTMVAADGAISTVGGWPSSGRATTRTRLPAPLYLMALSMRLMSTCSRRSRSPSTGGSGSATSVRTTTSSSPYWV